MAAQKSTRKFKAEVAELLDLIINSLYSNKEIFLRELISNASDAIDKLKYKAQTDPQLAGEGGEYRIELKPDPKARTLTISDNGVGMTYDEVAENIGTIAKSGTAAFSEALKNAKEGHAPELIGQFGVGFYSAFMVADKITLVTRAAGHGAAVKWESGGDGSYSIEEAQKDSRGTEITLHLRPIGDEDQDFADEWTLREVVKRHSDFVSYPVTMEVERQEPVVDETQKPVEGEFKKVVKTDVLNSMKAIWARPRSEVSDAEYVEFYKHVAHEWSDPLSWLHMKLEGTTEFDALIYIPKQKPLDFMRPHHRHGVQLYCRRVFIMDECKELLPPYLRFLRGVVDSADLKLNVSREILQEDRTVTAMKKALVRKVLDHLSEMEGEKYLEFYGQFGAVLKEGVHIDPPNREKLSKLLRYRTTLSKGEYVTLDQYVEGMKEGQENIYFITGDSAETLAASPHLEALSKKGIEVLLMTDPIDEFVVDSLTEYSGKKLRSAEKGEMGPEAGDEAQNSGEFEALLSSIGEILKEKVSKVAPSKRLTDSASCLCAGEFQMSALMFKLAKAAGQAANPPKRVLEVNLSHPLLASMRQIHKKDPSSPRLAELSGLLYDLALLGEGGKAENPAEFARKIGELAAKSLGEPSN